MTTEDDIDNEDKETSLQESLQTLQDLLLADLIDLVKNRPSEVTASDRMAILRVLQHYGAGTGAATEQSVAELSELAEDVLPDVGDLYGEDRNNVTTMTG